jgi:hypothetical protein
MTSNDRRQVRRHRSEQGILSLNIETGLVNTSWVTWEMRDLLARAESLFGSRDPAFEFAGVTFSPEGPQIRFSPCETRICLELSSAALLNPHQLRYQGAQEVIHILAPSKSAPMLEEGLAVWFAINGPIYGIIIQLWPLITLRQSQRQRTTPTPWRFTVKSNSWRKIALRDCESANPVSSS